MIRIYIYIYIITGAYIRDDADLSYTIENVVDGGMYNAGQSCCAIERVYVHEKLYNRFIEQTKDFIEKSYIMGDPLNNKNVNLGPIAQPQHIRNVIEKHVDDACQKNADIVTGGNAVNDSNRKGRFFQPTLIGNAT